MAERKGFLAESSYGAIFSNSRREKKGTLALLLCLLLLLTGCVDNLPKEYVATDEKLPEVQEGPEAPVGDSQSTREMDVGLFVPDPNTLKLTVQVTTIALESGQSRAEAAVEALLRAINENDYLSGPQPIRLASVSNAVETSGELVTVNLQTAARLLQEEALFALRVAITNTLTALPDIRYVNVLIDGRDIGLNFESTLPTGVLASYPTGDVSTLWGQIDMQRNASPDTELQKSAALYYISEDGKSLLSQVRNVTFPERDMAQYAKLLLDEMTVVASMDGLRIVVPPTDYFERDPLYIRPEGASLGYIYLYLHEAIDDFLQTRASTRAMMISSICYTLTSFIPQLDGIYVYVSDELVTQMTMMDGNEWFAADGLIKRSDFAPFVADTCTVYFPTGDYRHLRAVTCPVAQRLKAQPRTVLRELMSPPPAFGPLVAALPEGTTDADVLGLMIAGDTALVNFSEAFAEAARRMGDSQRTAMIYAIVNTLTELDGVRRVRFYFNGKQDTLGGSVSTMGQFFRHAGMII